MVINKLTCFVHRLAAEFSARWNDELSPSCKTPAARRLTPEIKRAFVEILRTPVLLSMCVNSNLLGSLLISSG